LYTHSWILARSWLKIGGDWQLSGEMKEQGATNPRHPAASQVSCDGIEPNAFVDSFLAFQKPGAPRSSPSTESTSPHEKASAPEDAVGNPSLYCPSARTWRCSGTLATAAVAVAVVAAELAAVLGVEAAAGGGGCRMRAVAGGADAGVTLADSGSRSGVDCVEGPPPPPPPPGALSLGLGETGCGVTRSA